MAGVYWVPAFAGTTVESMLRQVAEQARRDRELGDREPRARNAVHGGADALDFARARRDPRLHGLRAGHAVADHFGGEAPVRLLDRVEGAGGRRGTVQNGRARGARAPYWGCGRA